MFRSSAKGVAKNPVPPGLASPPGRDAIAAEVRVAQLLCSRLCHDLAGSAGAIHNGIELMSDDAGAIPAALSLVAASAVNLNDRLAFYRVTFGLGGAVDRTMTLDEAKALAAGGLAGRRVDLEWRPDPGQALPLDIIRLILVLVLVGADALPRGGTLRVRCGRAAAGTEIDVIARGTRADLPATLSAALNPDASPDALTSRTVHGFLAATLARRLGTVVALGSTNADEVALTASPPRSRPADPIPFPTS